MPFGTYTFRWSAITPDPNADADNALREELSSDYYVHLNNDGAALWAELLRDPANYSVHPRSIDYENAYY